MKREMCGESPRWKLKTRDCTNPSQFSGDNGERDPPVPIPNTEVKPFSADGTWLETTWESRTLPDSMKKNSPLMGWVLFSFHLQRSSPKSSLTERSTYVVRMSAPAPCGRNRGAISPGRVRSATPYFSDCPNQCAALYLVRILTAARCAGFRQAKSPGRVGRCRIP